MKLIQDVKTKDVAKYMALPGVIPRVKDFVGSGFGYIAHLMAIIYQMARLLPKNHPYTNAANVGRFGIRHVIAEAANNIVLKKENIDQIVIFFALALGILLLFLQFILLIGGFLLGSANAAAGGNFTSIFSTPACNGSTPGGCEDVAFMMLDKVFAVPGIYGSVFDPAVTGLGIPPFQLALHGLFQFYSMALLIVGALIFLYYIMVVVGETVTTGTPFGKRFNHIWAPIRLVCAIGLLVPINYGLNTAQYITLYTAKMGSSLATNAWITYNSTLSNVIGMADESLVAKLEPPDIDPMMQYLNVVNSCRWAYFFQDTDPASRIIIDMNLVKRGTANGTPYNERIRINNTTTYQEALDFFDGGNVVITFGEYDQTRHPEETGNVKPYCGEIIVPTTSSTDQATLRIQEAYFEVVKNTLYVPPNTTDGPALSRASQRLVLKEMAGTNEDPCDVNIPNFTEACPGPNGSKPLPGPTWKLGVMNTIKASFDAKIQEARLITVEEMVAAEDFKIDPELLDRGWGAAGVWYNKITEWNGALVTSAINMPTPSKMPILMENVRKQRQASNDNLSFEDMYNPSTGQGIAIQFADNKEEEIAKALYAAHQYWVVEDDTRSPDEETSNNMIYDVISMMYGIGGLFDMLAYHGNTGETNSTIVRIHPMAQLSALGKGIIETAIRNLMTSLGFSFLGGVAAGAEQQNIGGFASAMSGFFSMLTTVGLSVGFILYYILPFLPFMYFFFAVGKWVKSVFEAMVGVPLWALAHLKIDGNGLPGESAQNGYFLLFEIFLRPILCVFGLLASLAIFSAMANTLNEIFDLVVNNVSGFECRADTGSTEACAEWGRHIIDEFFFTIIYTILIYLMATASFKLIDQIPNNMLRWMGAGVNSFADQTQDQTEGLIQYAAIAGNQYGQQAVTALNEGAKGAGQAGGTLFGLFNRNNQVQVASTTPTPPTTP